MDITNIDTQEEIEETIGFIMYEIENATDKEAKELEYAEILEILINKLNQEG